MEFINSDQSESEDYNEDPKTDTNTFSETEYGLYGLCPECNEPNTGDEWCQQCNAKRFQQNFPNWTSGNEYVDKFIQESQLNARNFSEVLEWIPYNRLINIEYLAKGGFSTVYKATWLDGRILDWDNDKGEWNRHSDCDVAIKSLDNSSNINDEFLNEVDKLFL
jgi:hypothetical protein